MTRTSRVRANIGATMIRCFRSGPSLSGDKGFVAVAPAHCIGAASFGFVSWCGAGTGLALVGECDIPAVGPTVVVIVVAAGGILVGAAGGTTARPITPIGGEL